jgi:hypothetical protein
VLYKTTQPITDERYPHLLFKPIRDKYIAVPGAAMSSKRNAVKPSDVKMSLQGGGGQVPQLGTLSEMYNLCITPGSKHTKGAALQLSVWASNTAVNAQHFIFISLSVFWLFYIAFI